MEVHKLKFSCLPIKFVGIWWLKSVYKFNVDTEFVVGNLINHYILAHEKL